MIFLDEMKDLKIYNRPFWIPFDEAHKLTGSMVFLLTPNYESSNKMMNLPYVINRRLYRSYYMEKNTAMYINQEGAYEEIYNDTYIHGLSESRLDKLNETLSESKLSAEERQQLPNRYYGLPDKLKYPMPDEAHVIAAIRFFNKVDKEDEAELGRNIVKRIHQLKMETEIHVGEGNRFSKYWNNKKSTNESVEIMNDIFDKFDYYINESENMNDFCKMIDTIIECDYDINVVKRYIKDSVACLEDYNYDSKNVLEYVDYLNDIGLSIDKKVFSESHGLEPIITPNPTQTGENSPENGIWNSLVIKNGKNYRERVEALIFKDGKLFMYKNSDKCRFPGGSTEPDKSMETQLQNECREESRINITNIKYVGEYIKAYKGTPPEWVLPLSFRYDGCITHLFVCDYYSDFKGHINPEDIDNNMIKYGKFYTVDEDLLKLLNTTQKKAVEDYLSTKYNTDYNKQTLNGTNFYGYSKDISEVKNLLSKSAIDNAYIDLGIKKDKYNLSVTIYNDIKIRDEVTSESILLASKKLYNSSFKSDTKISYNKYVKSLLYLHCLTHTYNSYSSLTIPYANFKAGIEKTGNNKIDAIIRAFKGIEFQYGKSECLTIIKNKDYQKFISLGLLYGVNLIRTDLVEYVNNTATISNEFDTIMNIELNRNKYSLLSESLYQDDNEKLTENFTLTDIEESHISDGKTIIFTEALNTNVSGANAKFKKLLYKDRIKTNSELIDIYKKVKLKNPQIMYTYTNLDKYKGKNLFVDLSFYNETFFKNNMYTARQGLNIYLELLNRLINDTHYANYGYKKKTVFIPILDWDSDPATKMWMFKEDINPISIISELILKDPIKLKSIFGNTDFIFCGKNNYFKVNFSNTKNINYQLFLRKIKKLRSAGLNNITYEEEDTETPQNSVKSITADIIDKIETSKNIEINRLNFVGGEEKITKKELDKKIINSISSSDAEVVDNDKKEKILKQEKKKDELVKNIAKAAENSADSEEALEKLNDDYIKSLITDLAIDSQKDVNINAARASRIVELNDNLLSKEIKGQKISDMIDKKEKKELKSTSLNVASINEEWKDIKFVNFDKDYNQDKDIVRMLQKMSTFKYPISVISIDVEDTSDSEDYIDTYTVKCEDYKGKRFSLKFDIPKMINNKYMKLRGNNKTIQIQSFLMPIIKTDVDACQIVANYNKIFIYRFGGTKGKSMTYTDRFVKTINKLLKLDNIPNTKIILGNNTKICGKYELTMDYIDLASIYDKIETKNFIFLFNQDYIYKNYKVDESLGMPFGISKISNATLGKNNPDGLLYYTASENYPTFTSFLIEMCKSEIEGFEEKFNLTKNSNKYYYSQASIANTKIPLIIIASLVDGLTKVLYKAGIDYKVKDSLTKEEKNSVTMDYIEFSDGNLLYPISYSSSLLMNGLKECDTEGYSIKEVNNRNMYIDFLDDFGGRLKLDTFDNFPDCLIDPITEDVLKEYNLPTDYVSILLYANNLLSDNKFVKHTKMEGRRMRRNELIPAYFWKALTTAYGLYANSIRHSRNNVVMTMKKSVVIDLIMSDPTFSDKSILNALEDVEDTNAVSTKGLTGMNSERSYNLDKRTFDESMVNILGMSTGFAGNVGITRQATIDMSISGEKGYVAPINGDISKMSDSKTLTMTEAVTPFGSTRDDPFRTAMTFIQTAKHSVRTEKSDPLLVTNGADEAMAYMTSDIFAFKSKENGVITELVPNKYMIVKYDSGNSEIVTLEETIEKNSDGGFYVSLKLDTDLKVGDKVKENDILAYDKLSFSNSLGESDNLSYNIGPLEKIAIMNTDEGFEDSAIVSDKMTQDMATTVILPIEITLSKDAEIFNLIKVGDPVEEGDPLLIVQNPFDDEEANELMSQLNADLDEISDLGRRIYKCEITGSIAGIKIYRTCDIKDMSSSLQKVVKQYESEYVKLDKILQEKGISNRSLPPHYKLNPTGKMKNAIDVVKIVIFQRFRDVLSIGDKIVYYSANKGVVKYIIPKGKEPYTSFRPNEEISSLLSISSLNGRMVTSPITMLGLNKFLVELDRSVKDMAGIPYDDSKV